MSSRYRLTATAYEREDEAEKVPPLKMIFLSVEGNVTEKEYFMGVSKNRKKLGINAKIDIEVLKRSSKDTNSAPQHVIELLEEYIRLRELGNHMLDTEIPTEIVESFGEDFIRDFIRNPELLPKKKKNQFVTELMKIGYDINYRKYLQKYNNEMDEFAILIDRDIYTHSENNMEECIEYCNRQGYKCYIANPCFELWLLLHLSDVKEEYKECFDELYENKKISNQHTFVSKEVSNKASHGKGGINFTENYLPHVEEAIIRAKELAKEEELVNAIGCNLWKLMEDMMNFK